MRGQEIISQTRTEYFRPNVDETVFKNDAVYFSVFS